MNLQAMLIFAVVFVALLGGAGWLFNHQIEARIAAEQAAQAERTRADLSEARVADLETQVEQERERQAALQKELQAARDVEAKATAVVQDRERLKTLTAAKPGLLERRARAATSKVWSTIESESRE